MLIINTFTQIQAFINNAKNESKLIGFVPTMGALHDGHISLITEAKKQCQVVICSIFVNPTQFNEAADFTNYPKTLDADIELLKKHQCNVLFVPTENEVYPKASNKIYDFGALDKVLEGAHRPNHFNGVAQVLDILFSKIQPHKAFFGLKDYQQVLIVEALCVQQNFNIDIVKCSIVRGADGLAMSSRNVRLSVTERTIAAKIPKILQKTKQYILNKDVNTTLQLLKKELSLISEISLEYIEICNPKTLQTLNNMSYPAVVLIAFKIGNIRLIDNLELTL